MTTETEQALKAAAERLAAIDPDVILLAGLADLTERVNGGDLKGEAA